MIGCSSRAWIGGSLSAGIVLAATFAHGIAPAGAAPAGDAGNGIAALVVAVADADQKLQDLGAAIQSRQESVNKAIVDVANARDQATDARAQLQASQRDLGDASTAIDDAQRRVDGLAASAYANGPSAAYLDVTDPADALDTAATGQRVAAASQGMLDDLRRARTDRVNRESAARLAAQRADQAVAAAAGSQDAAVAALTQARTDFTSQRGTLAELTAARSAAQTKLDAAGAAAHPGAWSASATGSAQPGTTAPAPRAESADWDRDPGPPARPGSNWDTGWDPTLPAVPSAMVGGDPIAILNTVLGIATTSTQATQQMGRGFLQKLGILPTPSGFTNGAIPRVYGRQASEYVIKRAGSQMGVPYSWGGGTAAGPGRGIDSGAGTVGFDCSGLILYAFAGVGIKLDHYSGSQYNEGRKVPSSQARRGDVIFYGPGGSQHVALYLGNGQMLEAPYTGSTVKISPVRTSGMTPYVVRYIEY